GPKQSARPLAERQEALQAAQDALAGKEAELAAHDKPVTDLKAAGEALKAEVASLKTQIKSIEGARNDYLNRIDADIGKSRLETDRPSVPEETGPTAERDVLQERVRPVYEKAREARAGEESVDAAKPLGETTLVILGKKAQSDETKKLEADRAEVEA